MDGMELIFGPHTGGLTMADYRQQQELEEERLAHQLSLLDRIIDRDLAAELASELGVSKEWQQKLDADRKAAWEDFGRRVNQLSQEQ